MSRLDSYPLLSSFLKTEVEVGAVERQEVFEKVVDVEL